MTGTSGDRRESEAFEAFADVLRDGVQERTPAELDEGLHALRTRIALSTERRWGWGRWSLAGAVATACIVAGVLVGSKVWSPFEGRKQDSPLYRIEGGSVLEGGYLSESSRAGIKLTFSEGSEVVLTPGTRGRLRTVDRDGARVAIEQGTAAFQVATQGHDRRWLVEVGPFVVTVKGTVFTVSWDASKERFELSLRQGRVVVRGPVSGGDIVLRGGQRLVVSLPEAETFISELKPENPVAAAGSVPAPAAALSVVPSPTVGRERTPRSKVASVSALPSAGAKTDAKRRWPDQLLSGHWDQILDDVERAGVERTLEAASSEDLFALANAARYRRRTDLARAALLAERRRFPDSPRATDALFLLGRVEESRDGDMAKATAWYDAYLARAPRGPYAAEALGRKMTLTRETGGATEARPLAEEYLRRFPKGSYAGSARAVLDVP